MDIQTAEAFAARMERLHRVADRFGYDRARLMEELLFIAEDYRKIAAHVERRMVEEMG